MYYDDVVQGASEQANLFLVATLITTIIKHIQSAKPLACHETRQPLIRMRKRMERKRTRCDREYGISD